MSEKVKVLVRADEGVELPQYETDGAAGMDDLRQLDSVIALASTRVAASTLKRARLDEDLQSAQAETDGLNDEVTSVESAQEALRPGGTVAGDAIKSLVSQYQQEIENALRRKEEWRSRQYDAVSNLRLVQQELQTAYAAAELEFVPRFAALAQRFLGLDLEIGLAPRDGSIGLLLTIEGSRRRQVDQLSESQRYFIEIALRMALCEHMIDRGQAATLYIDTPEGSLDIAYESRAGDMFALFVEEGHRIVMTANINTSQLLRELARRCGAGRMDLHRMTDWTTLSEVQKEAEGLFDKAYRDIEDALSAGPIAPGTAQ